MGIRERKARDIETRRRLILSTATDLFVRKGFAGVTLDDIATAIEFSKGTIYNHFESKEEIFAAILLEQLNLLLASLRTAAKAGRDTADRLRNVMTAYLRFYRERREYFRLLFFIDVVSDQERVPNALRKEIRLRKIACLTELKKVVKQGVRAGDYANDRPAVEVSLVMWGMMNGVIQLAESRQIDDGDLERLLGAGFDIVQSGLTPKTDPTSRRIRHGLIRKMLPVLKS
jgi:AcrR family transcriptional regulator